jgi:hypothetical protein
MRDLKASSTTNVVVSAADEFAEMTYRYRHDLRSASRFHRSIRGRGEIQIPERFSLGLSYHVPRGTHQLRLEARLCLLAPSHIGEFLGSRTTVPQFSKPQGRTKSLINHFRFSANVPTGYTKQWFLCKLSDTFSCESLAGSRCAM